MRILVLGHGAVGSVLIKLLSKEKKVETIICGDINCKQERTIGKVQHNRIDLKDEEQMLAFLSKEKPDVVINATSPAFNERILDACVKERTNYMDMAAAWEPHPDKNAKSPYKIEQFDFDARFRENKLVGLIEAGVSPGMTNLLCKECAEEMDRIDTVKIRLVDYSGTDDLTFSWSKEALLDEINSKPLVYENSKFRIAEPFSGEEEFDYPEPFGRKKVYLICQDEIGTIPFFIKLRNIDIKDYDNQIDVHKFLYKLGLISRKKISIGNTEISPFDFMCKVLPDITLDFSHKKYDNAQFAFVVQASGRIGNAKKTIRYFIKFPRQKEINKLGLNANFISYPTALSAKLFALTVPGLRKQGIFPPEALDNKTRKQILNELRNTENVVFKKEIF